jgi:CRISPR/Cas system type I-B associated protein Csh2 (Cas7 group RAMP superfamily)
MILRPESIEEGKSYLDTVYHFKWICNKNHTNKTGFAEAELQRISHGTKMNLKCTQCSEEKEFHIEGDSVDGYVLIIKD